MAILCQFLLYKSVNQLCVYTYPLPLEPPFHLHLHLTPLDFVFQFNRNCKCYSPGIMCWYIHNKSFQVALVVKNPPAKSGNVRTSGSISGLGKIPLRRALQPPPVFLPGEAYGQRNLADYRLWGHQE